MDTIKTIRWALVDKGTNILSKVGSSRRPATFSTFDGLLRWYDSEKHVVMELKANRLEHVADCWTRV